MKNKNNTIKLLRSSNIYSSLNEAVRILNSVEHKAGQPIVVYYYSTEEKQRIDCIVAVGVLDGRGKKAYSILSTNNTLIVSKVYLTGGLEDITNTTDGSIFICYVPETNKNYWVFFNESTAEREVKEILNTNPILVKEGETGNYYWVSSTEIKSSFDYNTKKEFNNLRKQVTNVLSLSNQVEKNTKTLEDLLDKIYPFKLSINPSQIIIDKSNLISEDSWEIEAKTTYLGDDITNLCTYYEETQERELIDGKIQISSIDPFGEIEHNTIKISSKYGEEKIASCNLDIHYTYPTFWGKIIQGQNGIFPNWSSEDIKTIFSEGKIVQKSESYLGKKDEINYIDSFEINHFPFIAIPISYGKLEDIIDTTINQSLLNDFRYYSDIELSDILKYQIYIKEFGINSNGNNLIISFKFK